MTIIVFLVDTSSSMNQKTYIGTTLLDCAKGAIENFIKIRARDANCRWDRYMLLTFEDPPGNIKAGWKENHATFMNELKNLTAHGLTNMGPALKKTFDLLNVNRMQIGIDTYGQGRCPFHLEPAMIICITDCRRLTSTGGVHSDLNLPMDNAVPGSELTREPFRWDQRLFGLVLRIPAVPLGENPSQFIPPAEDSPIDAMCEVTGGRSYCISTHRMLSQCIESLVQKCQSGVVINFEKVESESPEVDDKDERVRGVANWHNCRKMIYVPRSVQKGVPNGHWPIPESFWPELAQQSIPARQAQPNVKFTCVPAEATVLENFPFDKYELEPSPLTQYILERRQPNVVWQTYIAGSGKYIELGEPFGYLKASSNLLAVNLYVMPYNYPVLIALLEELTKVHMGKAPMPWKQRFDKYLQTMPIYYAAYLKRALVRFVPAMATLVPDLMVEQCLSYSVVSYLKKLKNQAKTEYDRINALVGQRAPTTEGIKVVPRATTSVLNMKNFDQLLENCKGNLQHLKQEVTDFNTFVLRLPANNIRLQLFKNPYDISRKNLVQHICKMKLNLLSESLKGRLQDADSLHSQSVQQMGNYQEYLKKVPQPLRELEATSARVHTFGNPFKVNKNLMIDEADEAMPGQAASSKKRSAEAAELTSPRPNRRKPGPLPKDIPARMLMSPAPHDDAVDEVPSPLPPSTPTYSVPEPQDNVITDSSGSSPEMMEVEPFLDTAMTRTVNQHNAVISGASVVTWSDSSGAMVVVNGIATVKSATMMDSNQKYKQLAIKEVRKPGKNFTQLFKLLQSIEGSTEMRQAYAEDVKREAVRFKRKHLVLLIEQFQESIVDIDNNGRMKSVQSDLRTSIATR